jgi:hypothetical protein
MQPMAKQLTKQYGLRVHTMNELMVSLQGQGGNTDEDINFFSHAAKTRAGSNMRVTMGDFMVWAQKLDLSIH